MQESLKTQFISLQNIITSNINAIKSLIQQAESLTNLINKISPDNNAETNQELKKSLEKLRDDISSSIEELSTQTNMLFDTYQDLVSKIFR